MCHLSYLPSGVDVDYDGLANAGIVNDDGHGWAITTDYGIVVGKSMDLIEALDNFGEARKRNMDGEALFHSRFATHGLTNLSNVHPFFMGSYRRDGSFTYDTQTVVAHNGILPCTPEPSDIRSDTRMFADDILSTRFRRLDKERAFQAMSNWAGRFNKLVILTTNPRYTKRAYIVNEDAGNWDTDTGIWHSNWDYLPIISRYTSKTTNDVEGGWYEDDYSISDAYRSGVQAWLADQEKAENPDNCIMCSGKIGIGGYCVKCTTCEDCLEPANDCACWHRASDNGVVNSTLAIEAAKVEA